MRTLLVISVAFLLATANADTLANAADDYEFQIKRARAFLMRIESGDVNAAYNQCSDDLKKSFSAQDLSNLWENFEKELGKFQKFAESKVEDAGEYLIVYTNTVFEKQNVAFQISLDIKNNIAGFFVVPEVNMQGWTFPEYADTAKFAEVKVKVGTAKYPLDGILATPKNKKSFDAVILVHGSGGHNMDEEIGPNKPFRDLATGLSSQGIAVLRYDKRTLVYGKELVKELDEFTIEQEVLEDVRTAVDFLKADARVEHIYILGHSLGGYILPRYVKSDTRITGYVLLAASARPIEDLIEEQYAYIFNSDDTLDETEKQTLEQLKPLIARVKSDSLTLATPAYDLPFNTPASYWLDLRAYKPAKVAADLSKPVLVLQGARDYQVTTEDFELYKRQLDGKKFATLKLYPELNHLFQPGIGKSVPDEYLTPSHIDKRVIDDITNWIKNRK